MELSAVPLFSSGGTPANSQRDPHVLLRTEFTLTFRSGDAQMSWTPTHLLFRVRFASTTCELALHSLISYVSVPRNWKVETLTCDGLGDIFCQCLPWDILMSHGTSNLHWCKPSIKYDGERLKRKSECKHGAERKATAVGVQFQTTRNFGLVTA